MSCSELLKTQRLELNAGVIEQLVVLLIHISQQELMALLFTSKEPKNYNHTTVAPLCVKQLASLQQ